MVRKKVSLNCFCNDCGENNNCSTSGSCFFQVKKIDKKLRKTYGCFSDTLNLNFFCNTKTSEYFVKCCRNVNFCNQQFKYDTKTQENYYKISYFKYVIFCILFINLIILIIYLLKKKQKLKNFVDFEQGLLENRDLNEDRNTILNEIKCIKRLSTGKFGSYYHGKRLGIDVLIRTFPHRIRNVWSKEIEIYKVILTRHENVLNFIGRGEFHVKRNASYLIVTEFHYLGSLHNFLKNNFISEENVLNLIRSCAAAISHLHSKVLNKQSKPAMVHRNINSKNFIVRSDLTCVITNLGYILTSLDLNEKKVTWKKNIVMDLRFSPPEILNQKISFKDISFLKCADVYSFSLVMWQICRRCSSNNYFNSYQFPFDEYLKKEKNLYYQMKKLVLTKNLRPSFNYEWFKSEFLKEKLNNLLQESWHTKPGVRITIVKIEKDIQSMLKILKSQVK